MNFYRHILSHKLILFLFIFAVFANTAAAQEYSFTQYNIKEGLAGSTVYCMTQDRDGFMWFGTETGLSRFDGTHFRNFTTADGLPTNEIIKTFCDSRNRIWLSLFKNDVCYYYKGSIHNRNNDSILKNLHMTDLAWQICEDDHGNVLIMEQQKLHKIDRSGHVTDITARNDKRLSLCLGISRSANGNFLVLDMDSVYELQPDGHFDFVYAVHLEKPTENFAQLSPHLVAWKENENTIRFAYLDTKKEVSHSLPDDGISFNIVGDSAVCVNTINGSWMFDTVSATPTSHLVPGKSVSAFYIDSEQNYWCTTLGSGIYRINSLDFKNIYFHNKTNEPLGVYTVFRDGKYLLAGTDKMYLYKWNPASSEPPEAFLLLGRETENRITDIMKNGKGNLIIGSDVGIHRLDKNMHPTLFYGMGSKKIFKINDDSLLDATTLRLTIFNPNNFHPIDTVLKQRTNAAYYLNDTFYAATLDGLVVIDRHKHPTYLGNRFPVLKNTITDITSDEKGLMWISTYGAGIVGYYHGAIVTNITEADGLTSNICRCLYLDGKTLWVGTIRGLNKIDLSSRPYHIIKITSADALASDIINTIFISEGKIYVGTPDGITYFNADRIVSSSICHLRVTRIISNTDTLDLDADNFTLPPVNNDVSFRFAGISFKSGGDITYRYKLNGLDEDWHTTTDNVISYTTLPSGNYRLQMVAVNKFGVVSNPVDIHFSVAQTLWQRTWFKIVSGLMILAFMWLVVIFRTRYIRKRSEEKVLTLQRMNELEQMALKSQMNPHFIFNSLNSIQQYVMDKDVEGANRFITGFSTLIRRTLEFSSRSLISVAEEIEYLSTYLALEQERFARKFNYKIEHAADLDLHDIYIPPMILQPYVENSVRHGIRYRNDNSGRILITIARAEGKLKVEIEDNGVGRREAARYKSRNMIEYQSKGMHLTATRVEMMNKKSEAKIKISIDDLEEDGCPRGTRVTVYFPFYESNSPGI